MVDRHQFTQEEIYNQVVTGLGESVITNLATDQSTAVQVIDKNYNLEVEASMTRTSWRFATTKKALNKLSAEPTNRWSAAYQLPPDLLKLLTTWPPSRYERQGQRIYTNNTGGIEIDYIRKVEEAYWPPWFTRYVVARLIIKCCKGITGDDPSARMHDELRDSRTDALFQDAQEQPNQTLLPNDFIDCRY